MTGEKGVFARILAFDTLLAAWHRIEANDGAPGIDGWGSTSSICTWRRTSASSRATRVKQRGLDHLRMLWRDEFPRAFADGRRARRRGMRRRATRAPRGAGRGGS